MFAIGHLIKRRNTSRIISGAAASLLFLTTPASACDVALVLAIDVSGSVDAREYRLQAQGLSDALGDPVVSEALVKAKAIIAVVQWSGKPHQTVSVEWTATDTHEDVAALRMKIAAAPRAFINYSTGIGEALRVATDLLETAPRKCRRKVIDVSGDGPNNEGADPRALHARLDAAHITVNGLAIEGSEDGIAEYYRDHVIHGPAAFVEIAKDYKDFPRAIRRKLLRELADRLAFAPRMRPHSPPTQTVSGRLLSAAKQSRAGTSGANQ